MQKHIDLATTPKRSVDTLYAANPALRVQYNNVLRAVLKKPRRCSASEMFAEARVDDFYAIIRKRAASMMSRLVNSTNTLLSTLACRLDSSLWGAGMVCTRTAGVLSVRL
ncbi:jg1387 [Pararge aegeria aegeria]|uniref:Jg1387 protein n=1 Tax=Pararge aegeria aegeria TaxID=348720 RepID=A0A8S4QX14_9NEOP|nr:jg1387 [Pararge aegeria aegeria]